MKVKIPKASPEWHSEILQAAADGRLVDDTFFPKPKEQKLGDNSTAALHLQSVVCSSGCTCLHWAAGSGNLETVRFLLDHHHQNVDDVAVGISKGRTALHYACRNGHLPMVQCLVEVYGADADAYAKDRVTPFQIAVWQCRLPIVQYLVESCSVDPSQLNDFECGAIHWVGLAPQSRSNHVLPMAKYLHETLKLAMTLPQRQNHTALHKAAWGGHLDLVRYLHCTLSMWDTVRDTAGYTAAGLAVLAGNHEVACYLSRNASERTYNALETLEIEPRLRLDVEEDLVSEITRSYRRVVRQCHPDSVKQQRGFSEQDLLCQFHAVTEAYKWLIDQSEGHESAHTHKLPLRLTERAMDEQAPLGDSDDFVSRLSVILNEFPDKGLDISILVKKWRLVWPDVEFPYVRKQMGGRSLKQWLQREYSNFVRLKTEGGTVRLYPKVFPPAHNSAVS